MALLWQGLGLAITLKAGFVIFREEGYSPQRCFCPVALRHSCIGSGCTPQTWHFADRGSEHCFLREGAISARIQGGTAGIVGKFDQTVKKSGIVATVFGGLRWRRPNCFLRICPGAPRPTVAPGGSIAILGVFQSPERERKTSLYSRCPRPRFNPKVYYVGSVDGRQRSIHNSHVQWN